MSSVKGDKAKEIEEGQLALRLQQDMWDEYVKERPEEARMVEEWQDNTNRYSKDSEEVNISQPSQTVWYNIKTIIIRLMNGTGTLRVLKNNSPKSPTNGESDDKYGKDVITCFVVSFLLTFYYLYYNSPVNESKSEHAFISPKYLMDE